MIFPPLNVYCLYWFWEGNYICTAFLYREKKKVSKKKLSKTNGKINKVQKNTKWDKTKTIIISKLSKNFKQLYPGSVALFDL